MCNLEHENHLLIQEMKRTCKAETIHTRIKNEIAEKQMQGLTCEQVQTFEKVIKQLKSSNRVVVAQMHKVQSQLEEYRKKERIFNLHKRCAND